MLVINRREGESLIIGDGIEVRILELTHTRVKLGITAPEGVTILRNEILLARTANVAAAHSSSGDQLTALASALRSKSADPDPRG